MITEQDIKAEGERRFPELVAGGTYHLVRRSVFEQAAMWALREAGLMPPPADKPLSFPEPALGKRSPHPSMDET